VSERRADLDRHNRAQRRYFEKSEKKRMIPRPTPYLSRHVDELLRFGAIGQGERVLEVGCGMGRYTLLLAERGIDVEGLDLSPVLLARLREYDGGRHEIPLHCADVLDAPNLLDGGFDAVIGFFTLHHLHDLELSFRAMHDVLRPGGRIVFLEPNPLNPLYYVQMAVTPGMSWEGDGGIARMRPRTIFDPLGRAGFEDRHLERFGFFPPFVSNRRWGRRAEAVLERVPLWRPALPFQLFRAARPASV
jgi:SAM-dependent methyltransferase